MVPSCGCLFLPPANEVCEGYVFTPVCQSFCFQAGVGGGACGIQACLAGGIPGCLGGLTVGEGPGPHLGGCVSQHALRQNPPPTVDGYCHGRYASYWNAFLFIYARLQLSQFGPTYTSCPFSASVSSPFKSTSV